MTRQCNHLGKAYPDGPKGRSFLQQVFDEVSDSTRGVQHAGMVIFMSIKFHREG